ncbi:5-bromo-4-chloroindolyl phosphate hydrolysis protein [Virgibacillus natechei]|uniref:5-bromo-4-chloroindolyl phosphate hydrolysis protein n=1 Tax=Virgibacillus natechei TaxID=1216297 RepID=A0ABS4IH10_9BACI|nr:5-bromo-4-chloroindolyl phosphate hydrolysis family protein [Virgibacillus natechei]MBP1970247.1 5-bromo-4-chloroindolyl phosphate hydrolysis protein [Virgibacillus natechei]UZD12807.1 5-bromo-4-chloroindolyl phosphate hydrolysis family protein [Virgibacillus natechei]
MKAFLQFVLRTMSATSVVVLIGLISLLALDQTIWMATLYAMISGVAVYISMKQLTNFRYRRENGLSRSEYKYIDKNLKEAKEKITRLNRSLRKVGSFGHAKQNFEILVTVRKIYSNTKKEPKRFYKAEAFYYEHLDSLVALTEKYAYLSEQPSKTNEMDKSLENTRHTIAIMNETVKKDLQIMLNDDLNTLDFELDVAKQSINRWKKPDRRPLK